MLLLGLAGAVAADDDGPFREQDFLFLLSPAYTQEEGEWQAGARWDHDFDAGGNEVEFELEYGITERLQVAIEVPVIDAGGASGIGDIEFLADYAILKDRGGDAPELTIGIVAAAPTGDAGDGLGTGDWGYEVSLRAGKQVAPTLHVHALAAYEWVPGGGDGAESLREWHLGAGAAWLACDEVTLTLEYLHTREREVESGIVERASEGRLAGGIVVEVADDIEVGVAGVFGFGDAPDSEVRLGFQAEW